MRRLLALAALSALAFASSASAETWKPYSAVSATGLQWSYDTDYSYRDAQSKRVVVMQAVGKPGATPRLGPSAPGAADGVGNVMALDCKAKNLILVASYAPKKPLELSPTWRAATPKKVSSDEDKALLDAACAGADQLATR